MLRVMSMSVQYVLELESAACTPDGEYLGGTSILQLESDYMWQWISMPIVSLSYHLSDGVQYFFLLYTRSIECISRSAVYRETKSYRCIVHLVILYCPYSEQIVRIKQVVTN